MGPGSDQRAVLVLKQYMQAGVDPVTHQVQPRAQPVTPALHAGELYRFVLPSQEGGWLYRGRCNAVTLQPQVCGFACGSLASWHGGWLAGSFRGSGRRVRKGRKDKMHTSKWCMINNLPAEALCE